MFMNLELARSGLLIAQYIMRKKGDHLTSLHINKLVYFSHGWMLGLYDQSLVIDPIEAWKYGPVIPLVYHRFRGNGQDPIRYDDYYTDEDEWALGQLTNTEKDVMDQVVSSYSDLPASALISITHEAGSPWSQHYDPTKRQVVIPNQTIRDFFKKKSESDDQ